MEIFCGCNTQKKLHQKRKKKRLIIFFLENCTKINNQLRKILETKYQKVKKTRKTWLQGTEKIGGRRKREKKQSSKNREKVELDKGSKNPIKEQKDKRRRRKQLNLIYNLIQVTLTNCSLEKGLICIYFHDSNVMVLNLSGIVKIRNNILPLFSFLYYLELLLLLPLFYCLISKFHFEQDLFQEILDVNGSLNLFPMYFKYQE